MRARIAKGLVIFLCLLAAACIFIDLPVEPVIAATFEKVFYSYAASTWDLRRIDTDSSNSTQFYLPDSSPSGEGLQPDGICGVAVDNIQGKVYYWDKADNAIYQANVDGTGVPTVWLSTTADVYALSAYNGKVYYALGELSWNFVRRLAGGGAEEIIQSCPGSFWVDQSAIDPVGGYLYYCVLDTDGGIHSHIYRTDLSNIQGIAGSTLLLTATGAYINAIDAYNNYVYYSLGADGSPNQYYLMRMNHDGTGNTQIYVPAGVAFVKQIAVAPNEGKLYFFDTGTDKIYKTALPGSLAGAKDEFISHDIVALEVYSPPPAPEMSVEGNSNVIADGAAVPSLANHTDFGHVNVTSGTIVRTFTVYNTGNADLNLTGTPRITIAGAHSADFTVTANASASIVGGDSSTFQVTFNPSASGVRSASVSIANDDSDENPYNFDIQGTGTVAPVISNLSGSVTFTEGGSAVLLDAGGDATVTDADATGYNGGNVTIAISGGGNANEDLSIRTGAGVTLSTGMTNGSTVTVGATLIGAISTSTGQNGANLVINLNASANDALISTLLQNINYNNDSQDPSGSRTINFTVADTYDTSAVAAVTVNLVGVNDPPTLAATGNNPPFTEGGAAVDLYSVVTIDTIEAGQNILELILTVTNVTDNISEIMRIDGSDVALTNGNSVTTATNIMTVTVSLTGATANVTISKAGGITAAAMQTLVDSMTYRNTSDNPNTSNRVVTLTSIKDTGGTANGGIETTALAITSTVAITAVNDCPVVGNVNGDSVSVVAGNGATLVDLNSDATVSDVDSADFSGGNLGISPSLLYNGNFSVDGTNILSGIDATIAADEAIFAGGVNIGTVDHVYNGQDGAALKIDFNANATPARVETLIRNILYAAPTGLGARTFHLLVMDGDGTLNGGDDTSDLANFTINVTPNPPVITNLNGDSIIYDTFTGGAVIFDVGTNAAVTDPDSANFSGGNITVTISVGKVTTEDRLGISTSGTITLSAGLNVGSVVSVGGISIGTVSANGKDGHDLVVTFSSNATPALVTAILRALTYENTNDVDPSLAQRTVRVTITDAAAGPGAGTSAPANVIVNLGAPEINIQQSGTNIADGGSFSFGARTNNTNTDITFTVQNTGTGLLKLTLPITIGGANADQFSIQQQPAVNVAGLGATTFVIRFTPTSAGFKTATIAIVNTDGDETPYDITISGSGLEPEQPPPDDVVYVSGQEVDLDTDASGHVQHTYVITSSDGTLNVTIPNGTTVLDANGNPLSSITMNTITNPPTPPPGLNIIGLVFDLLPEDAHFSPALIVTMKYKHENIPPGVLETNLKAGYYNEATGEWVEVECTINTVTDEIICKIFHFSYYAVIGQLTPAAFSVSNLAIAQSENANQITVAISVDVANTGGSRGEYTIILKENGAAIDLRTVNLAAGAIGTVTFALNDRPAGLYNVEVNGLTRSYEIALLPTAETEPTTSPQSVITLAPTAPSPLTAPPAPENLPGWWIIGGIIAAGLILILIIWGLTRKPNSHF